MTNSWWAYRKLGKFLCRLDVIEYDTLMAYLTTWSKDDDKVPVRDRR